MPELMDIFNNDAFRMTSMTAAVNKTPYRPDFLGSLGIFTPTPIRTIDAAVAMTDNGTIEVVQTTPRGAPPYEQKVQPQNIRSFRTPRIAIGDTIYAHELQGILSRAMISGGDVGMVLQDLQSEIAYRLDGPTGLRSKQEATKERMRLGAIAGIVLDKDGSTLYNWATAFGVSLPAEIAFNLSAASPAPGVLTTLVRQTERSILRASGAGQGNTSARLIGLAGDTFFDNLIKHADVMPAWNVFQANAATRIALGATADVRAFTTFSWGGIDWINYRGTDDNATIAIAPDKVKFIPVGIPGLFQEVTAPAETFDYINTLGLPIYVMVLPDRDRNQFVRLETYSYPMYIATRPDLLFSGRAGT
jgi:hypothetical protein